MGALHRVPMPIGLARVLTSFMLLFAAFGIQPSSAAAPKNVLVLFSNEAELPADQAAWRGLSRGFNANLLAKPTAYTEFLDIVRFPGVEQEERVVEFLKEKYAAIDFSLVIVFGPQALDLMIKNGDAIAPNVPIVFAGIGEDALKKRKLPERATGVVSRWDFAKTLDLALLLQPDLQRVAVVSGTGPLDRLWEGQARDQFRSYEDRVSITYLSGLEFEDLLDRVAKLGPDSAIVFLGYFADPNGVHFIPREVLERMVRVADAPIYCAIDTSLGVGVVGGYMDTFEMVGEQTARLATRILGGENPEDIEPRLSQTHRYIVDWRALQRWGLSESALPPGSEVRDKQLTAWEQYRTEIIAIALVIVLQSVLLVGFYIETRRRRAAEREAKASNERMDLAISAVKLGLWDWNLTTDEIWATASCRELFGLGEKGALTRQSFAETVLEEDRARVRSEVDHAVTERRSFDSEYRVALPDGRVRWLSTKGSPKGGARGEPSRMVGTVIDITADKQAQLEAERQQREVAHLTRVSVLGALSGAIAHELNQPLTAILSNAQTAARVLSRDPVDAEKLREIVEDIIQDDRRAGDVIKHLRTLLRKGEADVQTVSINSLVCDVLALSHSDLILKNVTVSKHLGEPLPTVRGDPIQLQQVLINLIVNACEAMNGTPAASRILTINTRSGEDGRVRISVGDNGEGIPRDPEKLFDPFFTTKSLGLGLGLSICRSIVVAHGGWLWAESVSPAGAVFHVEIPSEASGPA